MLPLDGEGTLLIFANLRLPTDDSLFTPEKQNEKEYSINAKLGCLSDNGYYSITREFNWAAKPNDKKKIREKNVTELNYH